MKTPYAVLKISGGRSVMVDQEDKQRVSAFRWTLDEQASGQDYAMRKEQKDNVIKTIRLHNFILGVEDSGDSVVDHRNGNGLDNRKMNLRLTSRTVNGLNSKCKGYSYSENEGVYICRVQVKGITFRIGRYREKTKAIRAVKGFKDGVIKLLEEQEQIDRRHGL